MKDSISSMFICMLAVLFTACGNEEEVAVDTNAVTPQEFLNITYDGHTYYNVPVGEDAEGNIQFLDTEFSVVYNSLLANNTHWSVFASDEKNITFYDDAQTNMQANDINLLDDANDVSSVLRVQGTRATANVLATLDLYDDKNYKDRHKEAQLTDSIHEVKVPNLKKSPWKFNDKCSSLKITNNIPNDATITFNLNGFDRPCSDIDAVFIGYDDTNYSDRTFVCVAHPGSESPHASLPGFNDKLSSFKFLFALKGQYQ